MWPRSRARTGAPGSRSFGEFPGEGCNPARMGQVQHGAARQNTAVVDRSRDLADHGDGAGGSQKTW